MNILICGDFATCNRGKKAIEDGKGIGNTIKDVIRRNYATLVNFEAPVVCDKANGIEKYGPLLKTQYKTISYLKGCGVNCVTLANNHFYDYGNAGVIDTMETLFQNNMKTVGGGRNSAEKRAPLLLNDGKDVVCILNYCESEFSVGHQMGSNELNPIRAYYEIKEAVSKHQFVLVIVHGGHEGYQLPSPRMKQLYRFFIDCGANVVINHHQHCYSGYEQYNDGMIFYGLGNFFFDKISKNVGKEWFEGYMVGLQINNRLISYKLYPYVQCKDDRVETMLMEGQEKQSFYRHIEELNNIIANDTILEEKFKAFADSQGNNYLLRFSPYSIGKLMGAFKRGYLPSFLNKKKKIRIFNAISCEAHRDVCMYLLNK